MIVNHFKMRTNVMTYNLSGMGCSAGVISVGLAQQLLQVRRPQGWGCRGWGWGRCRPLAAAAAAAAGGGGARGGSVGWRACARGRC